MAQTKTQKTWHKIDIAGNWELNYKVGNSQGPSAFGGYHLPIYPNPYTGQKTFLKNVDGAALTGFMVDRLVIPLNPESNPNEKYLISWLICHPEVKLSGIKDVDQEVLKRKVASKLTLKWKDANVMDALDQEYYQDKMIGTISMDSNKGGLSLMKMRYVLAYLDMPYRDTRFSDYSAEKKSLRSKLSTYIRSNYDNAKEVGRAVENIDSAEKAYIFKDIVRLKIITMKHGLYYFNDAPIGGNQASVTEFMENHPEVKNEILGKLQK